MLEEIGVIERSVESVGEALEKINHAVEPFEEAYRSCLQQVLRLGLPTTVCTIYYGAFNQKHQHAIEAALSRWNEVIVQVALDQGLPIIDLRRVCSERADYTWKIEPNERGGRKIAQAIYQACVQEESFSVPIGPVGERSRGAVQRST